MGLELEMNSKELSKLRVSFFELSVPKNQSNTALLLVDFQIMLDFHSDKIYSNFDTSLAEERKVREITS